MLTAPEIEKVVLSVPQLHRNRIGQIVPPVIEVDCTVAVVDSFAAAQIDYPEIVGKCVRVFLEPQAESQNIIEALLEFTSSAEGFLLFPADGVFALEAGADQIFMDQDINIAGAVFCDVIRDQLQRGFSQGEVLPLQKFQNLGITVY